MKLIFGLGNPHINYKWTRHNVGFEAIDKLAFDYNINLNKNKFNSVYTQTVINQEKVLFIKPLTFMNLSGEAVKSFVDFYKVSLNDVVILCDDINLAIGSIKIKPKGSDGGQNGLKNVLYHLKTDQIPRIRIGIGQKPKEYTLANYVLSKFTQEEMPAIIQGITTATDAVNFFIKSGDLQKTMNLFNKKNT